MDERMTKRLVARDPPDTGALRRAMTSANAHLDYIDYLLDHRRWLAGPVLTMADLAAAAHLSVADYLGGIDWRGHKQTVDWYAVMKSRPSFRPLLAERMEVIMPPAALRQAGFLTAPARPVTPAQVPCPRHARTRSIRGLPTLSRRASGLRSRPARATKALIQPRPSATSSPC